MIASCLACSSGVTIAEFCRNDKRGVDGCPKKEVAIPTTKIGKKTAGEARCNGKKDGVSGCRDCCKSQDRADPCVSSCMAAGIVSKSAAVATYTLSSISIGAYLLF